MRDSELYLLNKNKLFLHTFGICLAECKIALGLEYFVEMMPYWHKYSRA